jgi:hypothetical protein
MHLIIFFFNLKGPVATPTYGHYNFLFFFSFFKKSVTLSQKEARRMLVDPLSISHHIFYLIQSYKNPSHVIPVALTSYMRKKTRGT